MVGSADELWETMELLFILSAGSAAQVGNVSSLK